MDRVYKRVDDLLDKAIFACQGEMLMYGQHDDSWSKQQAAKYLAVLQVMRAAQDVGRIFFDE